MDRTDWKSTLLVNTERAIAAGLVWTVVMLIWRPAGSSTGETLRFFLMFPLGYLCGLMPLGLLAMKLRDAGMEWAGIFLSFVSVLILVGDPLVHLLWRAAPAAVPVDVYRMFNRVLVIIVKQPAQVAT